MAELTPMKRQYQEIKEQHRDCLLFFRLGDFYEMFNEDAVIASRELDLALTTRDRNVEDPEERTPMCGVPYHSAEGYIARLIAKGYKVAICEQTEDPALAKGLVQRDVIRIITPGTVTESSMLAAGRHPHHYPGHRDGELDAGGRAQQLHLCGVSRARQCGHRLLRTLDGRILLCAFPAAGRGSHSGRACPFSAAGSRPLADLRARPSSRSCRSS